MKRPAFQFYPKDWRGNLKLSRCSDAAKGAWIQIMCVLHDSEEYGVVRFPLKELVNAAGVKPASARELVEKGVLKGGDCDVPAYTFTPKHAGKVYPTVTLLEASAKPMWYCSRFVRDEYIRARRGGTTRFEEGNPGPPKPTPKQQPIPGFGDGSGDGAAVASASALPSNQVQRLQTSGPQAPVDNPPAQERRTAKARKGPRWWDTEEGVVAEGKRRGIEPKVGESMEAFRQRVWNTRAPDAQTSPRP